MPAYDPFDTEPATDEIGDYYSPIQVARLTRTNYEKVVRLANLGEIPSRKVDGRWRIYTEQRAPLIRKDYL